jgi:hypothetical protein
VLYIQAEALDRTTGMGSISFHIHGERAPNAPIASNVAVYVSPSLHNNPAIEAAILNMRAIFSEDVAVGYSEDWLTRTVDAGYLSSKVLRPQSSPIKVSRSESVSAQTRAQAMRNHSPPLSPSISSVSSLDETASTASVAEPAPSHHSRSAHASHSLSPGLVPRAVHAKRKNSAQALQQPVSTALPTSLTMLSTVTLSGLTVQRMATGTTGSSGPLSRDLLEFMVSIGKGGEEHHDLIREIYNYTGRALWEAAVMAELNINSGTAKALVSLMLIV